MPEVLAAGPTSRVDPFGLATPSAPHKSDAITSWLSKRLSMEPSANRTIRMTVIGVAVIIIVAVVAAIARIWLVASPTPTTSYAFAPASYQAGLVVNRTWTLSGKKGSELLGSVILVNSVGIAISGSYDEVIPKSVAGSDSAMTFVPEPDQVVNADPVVRYKYNLLPGASVALSYSVDIGTAATSPRSRLQNLAGDQATAQTSYLNSSGLAAPATLAQVSIEPRSVDLQVGQSMTATLAGLMSDGSAARSAVLSGVLWSSSDRNVATVQGAVITAIGSGSATVSAQAGDLSANVAVSVIGGSSSGSNTNAPTSPNQSKQARSTAGSTSHGTSPSSSNVVTAPSTTGPTNTATSSTTGPTNTATSSTTGPTNTATSSTTGPTDTSSTPTGPSTDTDAPALNNLVPTLLKGIGL